ncbi:MAG: hypothetical protein IJX22_00500 [Opitutales bacterium]|nr:hypothetical protein [Opitutales bacterium]
MTAFFYKNKNRLLSAVFFLGISVLAGTATWCLLRETESFFLREYRTQKEEFNERRAECEHTLKSIWRSLMNDPYSEKYNSPIVLAAKAEADCRPPAQILSFRDNSRPEQNTREELEKILGDILLKEQFRGNASENFRPMLIARPITRNGVATIAHELFFIRKNDSRPNSYRLIWTDISVLNHELSRRLQKITPTANVQFYAPPTPLEFRDGAFWTEYQPWRIPPENLVSLDGYNVLLNARFYVPANPENSATPPQTVWLPAFVGCIAFVLLFFRKQKTSKRHRLFAETLAHELKNPLAQTRMILENLSAEDLPREERKSFALQFSEAEHRTESITENIERAFSPVESGNPLPKREHISLAALTERVLTRAQTRLKEAGMHLSVIEPQNARNIFVSVAPTPLEQILFNLADNAAKYARVPGQSICAEFIVTKKALKIRFADCGNGFSRRAQKKWFVPFFRDVPKNSPECGFGLGLALSRVLAEQLGGKLILEKSDSVGTSFLLKIPA